MAASDTININWSSTSGAQGLSGSVTDYANSEATVLNQVFGANTNAGSFVWNFNANGVQMLVLLSSQNCTIGTNNGTSPTNTLALIAGIPYYWERSSGYWPNAFNANTNAGFLTCTAATILNVRTLTN